MVGFHSSAKAIKSGLFAQVGAVSYPLYDTAGSASVKWEEGAFDNIIFIQQIQQIPITRNLFYMPPAEDFRNLDSKHSTEIVNISSKILDLLKN